MTILKKITSLLLLLQLMLPGLGLFPGEAQATISNVILRGTFTSATGNSAFYTISPNSAITVGKIALITVVTDNQATTDGCVAVSHQVTDTDGHTWNGILQCTETDGSEDDGVTVSFFWTEVTSEIGTNDTVTVTFSAARSDIVLNLIEVTSSGGNGIAVEQFTGAPASLSATLSSLTSREYLLVGLGGSEGEDTVKTPDADYTELVDTISGTNGQDHVNISAHVQYRIATLTGDTVTSTAWTNTNPIQTLSALYEVAAMAPTVTTGAASGITSATLSGNVTDTGGDDVDVRGFAWGTNSTLQDSGVFATTTETAGAPFGTGAFTQFVSGLISGTTYYYRAYATNGIGTSFGTIEQFTAGSDNTPSRKLRLFEGFTIKLREGGTLILRQQ